MKNILICVFSGYAKLVSPLLGAGKCRFYPSCSAYACEAVERHGCWRGSLLALRRVLACHPYGRRPFLDPVPSSIKAPEPHAIVKTKGTE